MNYASLFTGIGGFDLGFQRAGMTCKLQVEIDKNCRAVLERHFPGMKRINDVKEIKRIRFGKLTSIDLICGGFPCQDVSVAGRRAGLAGERSGLWHEFHRIIAINLPRWVVIENVPGLLSSCGCATCGAVRRLLRIHTYLRRKRKINQPCAVCVAGARLLESHRGRDFAIILRRLVECGYGVAWRILDAQYFGVAQRRRRVFIVGSLGDRGGLGRSGKGNRHRISGLSAQILFESFCRAGDTPPRRATEEGVARPLAHSTTTDHLDESQQTYIANPPGAHDKGWRGDLDNDTYVIAGALHSGTPSRDASDAGNGHLQVVGSVTSKWAKGTGGPAGDEAQNLIAFAWQQGASENDRSYPVRRGEYAGSISGSRVDAMSGVNGVRRLTPTECERLQGFPDGWTDGQSNSVRYQQLGNAVCVPVMEWIGKRIAEI